jgi:hypothetical protein
MDYWTADRLEAMVRDELREHLSNVPNRSQLPPCPVAGQEDAWDRAMMAKAEYEELRHIDRQLTPRKLAAKWLLRDFHLLHVARWHLIDAHDKKDAEAVKHFTESMPILESNVRDHLPHYVAELSDSERSRLQETISMMGIQHAQSDASAAIYGKWPWGKHDTKLLGDMAAAAKTLWKDYDPAQPDTAPTNEQVKKFLTSRGVAKRTAEVIATILRADGLPTGPRK